MDESSVANETLAATRTVIAERYHVLRVLGEGSSGIVYLCEHTALEKEVAVKVLHRELADNAGLVARFTREAQTAARLDHPNSVHVMDFGQDRDGTLYLVMEYVDGADLADLLANKLPLDDQRIVDFMSSILSALSAAHALGIVHRDLKPENVLVRLADPDSSSADIVKVCDFGVAQFSPVRLARGGRSPSSTQTRRVTGEGMMVGTPWYMSPEQARAEALDARSDIYSAGVVLFQLLTRTLPFMGDDVMAVALMHCTTPPPPPSGYGAVHPGLEAVCLKALSKTPDLRYQSANEMLSALREAVQTKHASRSLARTSQPPGSKLALAPISLRPEYSSTPMATPSVRQAATVRKVKPSLLVAGVATTLLGVAALPRLLPSQHRAVTTTLSAVVSRSADRLGTVMGAQASQLTAASVGIQNDPELTEPLLAAELPMGLDTAPAVSELGFSTQPLEATSVRAPTELASVPPTAANPTNASEPSKAATALPVATATKTTSATLPAPGPSLKPATPPPAAASAGPTAVTGASLPVPDLGLKTASNALALSTPVAAAPSAAAKAAIASVTLPATVQSAKTAPAPTPVAAAPSAAAKAAIASVTLAAPAQSAKTAPAPLPLAAAEARTPEASAHPNPAVPAGVPESPGQAAASAAEIALATLPPAAKSVVTPAPKTPAAPPKAPAPIKFSRVEVNAERLPPGASRGMLRSALNQVALLACYTQAQQRSPQIELPGTALELRTNTSGHIVWARATNASLAHPVRECLEQVARSGQLRTGEGGEVRTTVNLLPLP